jgi:hypothetical protein
MQTLFTVLQFLSSRDLPFMSTFQRFDFDLNFRDWTTYFDPYVFAFQEILITFALFILMWFSIFAIITSILVLILTFVKIYFK